MLGKEEEYERDKSLYDRRFPYIELFGMRQAPLKALFPAIVPISRIEQLISCRSGIWESELTGNPSLCVHRLRKEVEVELEVETDGRV